MFLAPSLFHVRSLAHSHTYTHTHTHGTIALHLFLFYSAFCGPPSLSCSKAEKLTAAIAHPSFFLLSPLCGSIGLTLSLSPQPVRSPPLLSLTALPCPCLPGRHCCRRARDALHRSLRLRHAYRQREGQLPHARAEARARQDHQRHQGKAQGGKAREKNGARSRAFPLALPKRAWRETIARAAALTPLPPGAFRPQEVLNAAVLSLDIAAAAEKDNKTKTDLELAAKVIKAVNVEIVANLTKIINSACGGWPGPGRGGAALCCSCSGLASSHPRAAPPSLLFPRPGRSQATAGLFCAGGDAAALPFC